VILGNLKPRTVTTFWVIGAIFDALVAAMAATWLLSEGLVHKIAFTLLLSAGPTFVGLAFLFYWMASGPERMKRLRERGTRGVATVRSADMTGASVNAMPVLRLNLEVNVPGQPPYFARDRVLAYPGTIERGATLDCVVDPKNPHRVAVLFEQPVLKEPAASNTIFRSNQRYP
jgi:hypothetical protein